MAKKKPTKKREYSHGKKVKTYYSEKLADKHAERIRKKGKDMGTTVVKRRDYKKDVIVFDVYKRKTKKKPYSQFYN